MYDLERIKKSCLWDYDFSSDELLYTARDGNESEKKFLFVKIFEHSNDVLNDLDIFSEADKKTLLQAYQISGFNKDYLQKKYKILRHFILGESVAIRELAWRI
jgi:hypothetical protein